MQALHQARIKSEADSEAETHPDVVQKNRPDLQHLASLPRTYVLESVKTYPYYILKLDLTASNKQNHD